MRNHERPHVPATSGPRDPTRRAPVYLLDCSDDGYVMETYRNLACGDAVARKGFVACTSEPPSAYLDCLTR